MATGKGPLASRRLGRRAWRRCGFSVIEQLVATAMLGVTITVAVAGVVSMSASQRDLSYRGMAMIEARNILELAQTLPWDQVSGERLEADARARGALAHLPHGDLEVVVEADPASDEPETTAGPTGAAPKRMEVTVRWKAGRAGSVRSIHLVGWRYPDEVANEP